MKKANTLLLTCALLVCSIQLYGMACQASDSTEFKACLSSNATEIQIMADFTVHLTGFSLKGVTIKIGSKTLTITGNPSLDSTTKFNTSGTAGELIIITPEGTYLFKENINQGGFNLDFLNNAVVFPLLAGTLYEAITQAMILPVTWGTFSANLNQQAVVLEWTTNTELNNDKFVIENSSSGELFYPIGQLKGAGTSSEGKRYRFVHHNPSAGTNYYRLKQVDFNGSYAYSKILAVEALGKADMLLFPNPTKDQFYLQYPISNGPSQIQLFDALGRRIKTSITGDTGNYEVKLPESLAGGTYWLKIERGGKVQTLPIIKQ